MANYNLNYLIKDELIYELMSRGQVILQEDVNSLRKQLRTCQTLSPELKHLEGKLTLKQEFDLIENKLSTLELLLEQSKDSSSKLVIAKIKAKLTHLGLRITHLKKCKLDETYQPKLTVFDSRLETCVSEFDSIKNSISEEDLAQFEEKLNNSMVEEEEIEFSLDKHAEPKPQSTSTPFAKEENMDKEVKQPEFTFKPNLVEEPRDQNRSFHPANPQSIFSKITNPLETHLQKFPLCDGLDINSLLKFLRNLIEVQNQTNLTSPELFEILPTYATHPLVSKILEHKNTTQSLEQLHTDIINTFIPITLKEKLKQDLIFRPQKQNEPLSLYIHEIKINHLVLKTNLTESELVCFIKNGIHPEVRNKLVFEKNPQSFKDLDQLCINLNNVSFSDYMREQMTPSTSINVHRPRTEHQNPSSRHYSGRNFTANEKICYQCNRKGHIAKQCFRGPKNL